MKTFLLYILLVTCISVGAYCQAPVTAEQKAMETVNKLKTSLGLSEEQAEKVKTITVERIQKVTAATKKYGADKQRISSASALAQQDWEDKLKQIVSAEQFQKYLADKNK